MKRKMLLRHLLFPPIWLLLLLVLYSACSIPMIFVRRMEQTVFAYVSYAASFYTLAVLCIFFCTVFPKEYRAWKQALHGKPLAHRFLTDVPFRTHVLLYVSFAINLLYAGAHALSYTQSRSMWFVLLAVYYAVLAVMRFLLARRAKSLRSQYTRAILCACMLLTVNFVLSGAVLMILYVGKGFVYDGILIYVVAAYTFYFAVQAIRRLIRRRKSTDPVVRVADVISLSASLVSMLSLETAMLSQFGKETPAQTKWLLIVLTGAGVSIAIITLSVLSIVRSVRERKYFLE